MPKYLDQEQVTRYAQVAAEIKKLEEQKSVLREELIAGFKEGQVPESWAVSADPDVPRAPDDQLER